MKKIIPLLIALSFAPLRPCDNGTIHLQNYEQDIQELILLLTQAHDAPCGYEHALMLKEKIDHFKNFWSTICEKCKKKCKHRIRILFSIASGHLRRYDLVD